MFINLSNHKSSDWSEKQLNDALQYGEIIDLPFPEINPYKSRAEINELAEKYFDLIIGYDNSTVMVQGEYTFTFKIVEKLKKRGIKVVAACSERKVIEKVSTNGTTIRQSVFEFIQFREY